MAATSRENQRFACGWLTGVTKLGLSGVRSIEWHDGIDEVPEGPSIILANEYFDVLPIHQMVKRENGWHERVVDVGADGKLQFGAAAEPTPRFDVLLPPLVRAAPVGAVFEWRPDSEMMKLATRVRDQDGAALIIDYGHLRSDAGDTFQAIARHTFADPLKAPGQADVTAHVDFQALSRAAEVVGARVHGPVTQGEFLKRLGVETRAAALMQKATPEVSVQVEPARLGDISQVVTAEAVVFPLEQAVVTPKITSTIKSFPVQRGAHVRKGQLLAVLENSDLSAAAIQSKC